MKLFGVCSLIGLLILVPVNYTSKERPSTPKLQPMDSFTVTNVTDGSNRLWVHFSCLCFITCYIFYLLHREYTVILHHRVQHFCRDYLPPYQVTVLVRGIPLCLEHKARGCSVKHFFSKLYPKSYQSCQMLYEGKSITKLLNSASSLQRKIKRSETDKQKQFPISMNLLWSPKMDISSYKRDLQDTIQKIHLLQTDTMGKKELPVAFVQFKSYRDAALVAQTQQHFNPLLWITEFAPEPRDIIWNNLVIPYRLTAVQGIAQFEKLKKWFPPARAMQLIPGLSSIITGYLPSLILNCFIYVVPYAMLFLASLEGCISSSKMDIKACSMVFYFLVGNVFFLSVLSGSLLHQIGESFEHPKDIPGHLATAVSAQSDFFITYILTDGLSGFSMELLQLGLLSWHFARTSLFSLDTERDTYLFRFPYFRVIPNISLAILIGMIYAVVAPLLLPFLVIYFLLGYAVYINQMHDVYEIIYDTHGEYWPYTHHYLFITLCLMQVTVTGLFGLKSKPGASIATIPILIVTVLFNEYCKVKFLPTFLHWPILTATENDECRGETEGQFEANTENDITAYVPPWMLPFNHGEQESPTEPLISTV